MVSIGGKNHLHHHTKQGMQEELSSVDKTIEHHYVKERKWWGFQVLTD